MKEIELQELISGREWEEVLEEINRDYPGTSESMINVLRLLWEIENLKV